MKKMLGCLVASGINYGSNISPFFVTLYHKLFSFTSVTCVHNLLMTGQVEIMTTRHGDGKRMTEQATGDNNYRIVIIFLVCLSVLDSIVDLNWF